MFIADRSNVILFKEDLLLSFGKGFPESPTDSKDCGESEKEREA